MERRSPQAQIELFHLLFLKQISGKIDPAHFALKGGCNLRFFFKSIRYSEDIDLDVRTIAPATLKNQVTKLLEGTPLQQVLRTRKLAIMDVSALKQTETTQRWKLKIRGPGSALPLPTKIEFSRRGMESGFAFEPVDAEVLGAHQLYPVLTNHYLKHSAMAQKIRALISRTETQARDVFDLNLLLNGGPAPAAVDPRGAAFCLSEEDRETAITNLLSVSHADYRGQVVSFLLPEYQRHFGTSMAWDRMQMNVMKFIEGITKEKS